MADFFLNIGILVVFATLAGLIANRLRQPPVLGLLAIGAVIGPNLLGWVTQSELVNSFADIGAVLLLFTIGFEFSLSRLFEYGKRSFFIALSKLGIVFFLTFELASLAGLDATSSIAIGAIVAITSTALMIRLVEQKSLKDREEIPLLLGTLVIEDIFAVIALTMISGLGTGEFGAIAVMRNILFAIFALIALYAAIFMVLNRLFDWITKYQARETMIFLALSIGIGFSYFAEYLGLTPSIGAFLAGSLVASMPRAKTLEESIHPFSLAFSSIFFVSIGMLINLGSVWSNIGLVLLLCAANLVFKFAGAATSTYIFGFNGRQAAFSGLAMLSVGEFSLLIAKEAQASVPIDLLGITSALVFTSVLATSMFANRSSEVYLLISRLMPPGVKRAGRETAAAVQGMTRILEHSRKATDVLGRNVLLGVVLAAALFFLGRAAVAQWSGLVFAHLYGLIVTTEWVVAVILLASGYVIMKAITHAFSQVGRHMAEWQLRRAKTLAKIIAMVVATPFLLALFETSPLVRQLSALAVIALAFYWFSRASRPPEEGRQLAFFKR
ncbi:MAG: cation:proton antiporter [Candidatus Micrarchaeota archaeon]